MSGRKLFAQVNARWQTATELIEKAAEEQLAAVGRLSAVAVSHHACQHGDSSLLNLFELLDTREIGPKALKRLALQT